MTTTTGSTGTIFSHETEQNYWHIERMDDSFQYPYSVYKDKDYICSRKTFVEAMDLINTFCSDISDN